METQTSFGGISAKARKPMLLVAILFLEIARLGLVIGGVLILTVLFAVTFDIPLLIQPGVGVGIFGIGLIAAILGTILDSTFHFGLSENSHH